MKVVKVSLGPRSYSVYVGKDILSRLSSYIKPPVPGTPLFVVTNRRVGRLYARTLQKALLPVSRTIMFHEVPDSEKAKSFPVYIQTIRKLARFSRTMKPFVFSLGGGVVGDLTGFVASAYRRGVPYVHIPTTLLAQVDSAIGGKVAIDIQEAKNMVGNFYQPKAVFCDLRFLTTLPEKELRNGLVEVVKYGIIKDRGFFSFLEKNIDRIFALHMPSLERIVSTSCRIKARVVERDEFDVKDVRSILNFGHTLGHAIEAASTYAKAIPHGRAVALGMIMASSLAVKLAVLTPKDHERICACIRRVSPKGPVRHLRRNAILCALSYDKKFIYGQNRFILPRTIGCAHTVDKVPNAFIRDVIKENLSV